ncbi:MULTISPECIES: hypothetical protein [Streptomyces]|uniref:hypothetical protein n=1 Tax=Streptomyces lycopersici TaxID=2974589 RepID=UPI0021D18458|nr:hypothetical protein [Streptomyces sp. NEAU-383]
MSTGERSEARRKAVAVGPGVCHALGLMMLAITEWVRADLKDATSAASHWVALWAAVFMALVVRLNRYGPEEAHCRIRGALRQACLTPEHA